MLISLQLYHISVSISILVVGILFLGDQLHRKVRENLRGNDIDF